jgi:FixJ family two-component response regulator
LFAGNGGREVRPYAHVDDDPAILESTGDVVEAFIGITGWQYLTCSQLLSDLVRVHYVVVIVDYNSRLDLNGDVCTERILQIDPQTIIIGHSNNEMEAVFKRAGARYFISKTGGPLILIDLLKSLLGL